MSHRTTITVPLEDDGIHTVADVADNLTQEYATIEFEVTDDDSAYGTIVRFTGDEDELHDLVITGLNGLQHLIERA